LSKALRRENVRETAPDVVFKDSCPFGILPDAVENRFHCRDETKLQIFLTARAVLRRILEFRQRFGMNSILTSPRRV
jgi:hypothetical protein